VLRLAGVRRAGQRELLLAHGEAIGGAAFNQGKRLQWLDRRAREHRSIDVTGTREQAAVGSGHGKSDAMLALHALTSPHQDGHRRDLAVRSGHARHLQDAMIRSSWAKPSVSAARPGCRIGLDLISCS
jgi:hypothetical protein